MNPEQWRLIYRIQDHELMGYCSGCEDYGTDVSVACWKELNRAADLIDVQETLRRAVLDSGYNRSKAYSASVSDGMTEGVQRELLVSGWCERDPGGGPALFLTEAGYNEGCRLIG